MRVSAADANVVEGDRKIFRVLTAKGESVDYDVTERTARFETTPGRIIFNRQCLPADYPFINYKMVKSDIGTLVNDCCDRYTTAEVEPILDAIKETGFHYATLAGLTVSVWDATIPRTSPSCSRRRRTASTRSTSTTRTASCPSWSVTPRSSTPGPSAPTFWPPRCSRALPRTTPST